MNVEQVGIHGMRSDRRKPKCWEKNLSTTLSTTGDSQGDPILEPSIRRIHVIGVET